MVRAATRWLVAAFVIGAGLGLGLGSCAGNHSSLAKTDGGSGPGGSGGGGAGGAGASGGATISGGAGTGGTGAEPEPAGSTKLTIVNGVVDGDAIRLCALPYPASADAQPWPASDSLGFARSRRVEPLDALVPSGTDVQLYALGGDLSQSYGPSCSELVSAPAPAEDAAAPLLVASLGVLPASVLASERSLLLVPYGCLGGPGHTDLVEDQVCGAGYAPGTPMVGLSAASMSRITDPNRLSLQFAHASAATPVSQLRMRSGDPEALAFLVTQYWSLGAMAPYPPWTQFSLSDLIVASDAAVEIYNGSSSTASTTIPLGEAFANSDLGAADLADGGGYVLIAVGATAGLPDGPWWHRLTLTMVLADP